MGVDLRLSKDQTKLYDLIADVTARGEYSFQVPFAVKKTGLTEFVKIALGDYPERINYNNTVISYGVRGFKSQIMLHEVFGRGQLSAAKRRFDEETQNILRRISRPGASDAQKALAIHDYLVGNVVYDIDYSGKASRDILSHTAYGAIVEKRGVCEGIAFAFSHLAKCMGLKASIISGTARGGDHSWNIVQIGADCFHVDATWDITFKRTDVYGSYDYFCLSDRELVGRTWDFGLFPPCVSGKYNYFNVTGSYAHNREQLRSILLKQFLQKGAVYLKCDFLDPDQDAAFNYVWNELVSLAREHRFSIGSATGSVNEELGTIAIFRA